MREVVLSPRTLPLTRLVPVVLLLLMFWSSLSSIRVTAGTYDEYEYIARGYTYLVTENSELKLRHPVLLDSLAAVPLLLLPEVKLPLDSPALAAGDFHVYARNFLWEANGAIANRMIFLARLPVIVLSLLLATAVFVWGRQLFGLPAGLVAMALMAFDPNWLAHGRLVTPDAGQSAFIFFAVFAWWRCLQKPVWYSLLLAGFLLGLAQTAGFPALILYPLLFLTTVANLISSKQLKTKGWTWLLCFGGLVLGSLVTIWAVYRLDWGPLPWLGVSGPAPYHWAEFQDLLVRLDRRDLAYLNGEVYRGGKAAFFIAALLLKTPVPVLTLAGLGLIQLLRRQRWLVEASLWLVPVAYYVSSLTSSLNIGYRHILPILPFLYVWGGSAVLLMRHRWQKFAGLGLLVWLVAASWSIYPYYLTYFNELAGGARNGLNYLVVSDVDWGQDLPGLADFLAQNDIGEVYLSYFGTTPPEQFGIRYLPIPAWPPRGIEEQLPFHPHYPLPGTYAISAANLVGARFEDNQNLLAWFRAQEPKAIIGNSIYVYDVPRLLDEDAPQVNLLLSGLALTNLPDEFIVNELHTNNLLPRWFDSQKAMVLSPGKSVLILPDNQPVDPFLKEAVVDQLALLQRFRVVSQMVQAYSVSNTAVLPQFIAGQAESFAYVSPVVVPDASEAQLVSLPITLDTAVTFLGWRVLGPVQPGKILKVMTAWRIEQEPARKLAIFMHLLAPDGSILAQFDGLDATSETLHTGDVVIQLHGLMLPTEMPGNVRWLNVGIYDPDSMVRLQLPDGAGDRLLLPLPDTEEK